MASTLWGTSTRELNSWSSRDVTDGRMVGFPRNGLRRDLLVYWCEAFRLDKSGTVPSLKEALKAFSADRAAWDR